MNQRLFLSEKLVSENEEAAVKGDPKAAMRLFYHYSMKRDRAMADKYVERARELGDADAKLYFSQFEK